MPRPSVGERPARSRRPGAGSRGSLEQSRVPEAPLKPPRLPTPSSPLPPPGLLLQPPPPARRSDRARPRSREPRRRQRPGHPEVRGSASPRCPFLRGAGPAGKGESTRGRGSRTPVPGRFRGSRAGGVGKPKAARLEKWGFGWQNRRLLGVKGEREGTRRTSLVRGRYSPGWSRHRSDPGGERAGSALEPGREGMDGGSERTKRSLSAGRALGAATLASEAGNGSPRAFPGQRSAPARLRRGSGAQCTGLHSGRPTAARSRNWRETRRQLSPWACAPIYKVAS